MHDYYLQTWYIRVASRVAKRLKTYDLTKLGNIRKVPKVDKLFLMPSLPAKMKILLILAKTSPKIASEPFPQCATSHET